MGVKKMKIDIESQEVKDLFELLKKSGLYLTGSCFLKKHGLIDRDVHDIDVSCNPKTFSLLQSTCESIGAKIINDNSEYEDYFAKILINGFEVDVFKNVERPNVKNILKAKFDILLDNIDSNGDVIFKDKVEKHKKDIFEILAGDKK